MPPTGRPSSASERSTPTRRRRWPPPQGRRHPLTGDRAHTSDRPEPCTQDLTTIHRRRRTGPRIPPSPNTRRMKATTTASAPAPASADDHVNHVELVGELAGEPELRHLPSGDAVVSFRLTVRTPGRPRAARLPPARGSRGDSIDCAVWRADVRSRLRTWRAGDVLAVTGALHHRYWWGPQGLASRYEVEVSTAKVLRRARVVG